MEHLTETGDDDERRPAIMRRGLTIALLGATSLVALHDFLGVGGVRLDFAISGPFYDLIVVAAGVACLLRRAVSTPRERSAWIVLGAAILAWASAEICWTWLYFSDPAPPAISPADIGYLAFYPLALWGLWLLVRVRMREIDLRLWMDALVAALGTAALGTTFVFDFVADRTGGAPADVAIALAYPMLDIVLLSAVVGVIALTGWRPGRTWTLLLVGLAATAIADIGYTLEWSASLMSGDWTEPVYLLSASALGIAAWQPDVRPPASFPRLDGWRELTVPAIFGAIVVGLLLMQYASPASGLSVALAAATVIAILIRLAASVRQNQALLERARTDALTGLGSRGLLQTDLAHACRFARAEEPVALLLFDLNGFKLYNDTFGHPAGDALLSRLGGGLRDAVSPDGTAYRIGGDEFCVLLDCEQDRFGAAIEAAEAALREDGGGFEVAGSWGCVVIPDEVSDPSSALQIADMRMYEQKDSGRVSAGSQVEEALLQSLEERQPELGRHVHSVAEMAVRVGQRIGLEPGELTLLRRAAELHDIGKMAIPDAILDKPGPLDTEERRFIERHTLLGERIIAAAPSLAPVARIVRSSHERFDGTGYPDELAGDRIPLASRIVFACDAFNAMTTDRPYSVARSVGEAIEELRFCAGGQFDPAIVEALCAEVSAPATALEENSLPIRRRPSAAASRRALDGVTALEP